MPRPRLRRLAASAFVPLVLVVAPVAEGAAQAAPRPQPGELWQQFPLDPQPAKRDARANARGAPRVAPRTSVATPQDQGGGSTVTLRTAAIVLATALVLFLMAGALVYVRRRPLALTMGRLHAGWRQVDAMSESLRRATGRLLAAASQAARAATARFRARTLSEAAPLKTQLSARTLATNEHEAAAAGTLKDRLDLYLVDANPESLEPEPDPHLSLEPEPDPHLDLPRSLADDELEILKAKLGKPAAPVDDFRADEVETLKAKLGGEAEGTGGKTTPDELKRKLADRRTPLKSVPTDADVDLLKAKLEAPDQAGKHDDAASVDVDTRDDALDEVQRGPADLAAVPPSEESAELPRSRATASGPWKLSAPPSKPSSEPAPRSRRSRKQWFVLELERGGDRPGPEPPGRERG